MPLARSMWTGLYEDAAGLVKAIAFLGGFSKRSFATLDEIGAPAAWVDGDSPSSLRRADVGPTHAYLVDLLLQPFLAWQANAVLVVAEADCHLLADIAKFLVDGSLPRPFPIPDLREVVRPGRAASAGRVPDLGLENLADVEAKRQDPDLQAYARRFRSIVAAPEPEGVGERLDAALAEARSTGGHFGKPAADIAVGVEHAGIMDNSAALVAAHRQDLGRLARRTFAPRRLRTLVLA